MKYSIGEFSRITHVTVKALRLYHDRGLLVPDFVDPESGYRYYASDQVAQLRVIRSLKRMGFSLLEIAEILDECEEDCDLVDRLNTKKADLEKRVSSFRETIEEIETIIRREGAIDSENSFESEVEEKILPPILVAGHRMIGKYSDAGIGFKLLGRHVGRFINGKAMCLYYDSEYKENDADLEPCFEVKRTFEHPDLNCRELPGGRALTIVHEGPYERLGESYEKLFEVLKREKVTFVQPTREVYLKGPGMILKGNPEKYLTEIQFIVGE